MKQKERLHRVLRDQFGLQTLRKGQKEVIRAALQGRDVFARMPTGHGKSLCFQLPAALDGEGTTIVFSPLIALMRDQVRGLVARGIPAADLHSGHEAEERQDILARVREGAFRILYIAPEQLGSDGFREQTKNAPFSRLVVDEAHCISHWGHDFRPSYRRIAQYAEERSIDQIMGFTATASRKVASDVEKALKMKKPFEYFGDLHRPNLEYKVEHIDSHIERAGYLLRLIREYMDEPGGILIYCATRKQVMDVFDFLNRKGLPVGFYHAGVPNQKRKETEQDFFNNKKRVMIATNAFGMGIDKPDIRLLVHFSTPGNVESYLQETGRAGRDGEDSLCLLFYGEGDLTVQRIFKRENNPDFDFVHKVYALLQAQKRRACDKEGAFEISWQLLERGAYSLKKQSRIYSITSIHAAISVLEEFGMLEICGRRARLKNFDDEAGIRHYISEKEKTSDEKLMRMAEYAKTKGANQQFLINFLEAK